MSAFPFYLHTCVDLSSGKWEQDQLQHGKAAGGSFTGSSGSNWRQSN